MTAYLDKDNELQIILHNDYYISDGHMWWRHESPIEFGKFNGGIPKFLQPFAIPFTEVALTLRENPQGEVYITKNRGWGGSATHYISIGKPFEFYADGRIKEPLGGVVTDFYDDNLSMFSLAPTSELPKERGIIKRYNIEAFQGFDKYHKELEKKYNH